MARAARAGGLSVLRVIDSLAPGGAERSLVELAPHLVAAGVRLEVAVLHDGPGLRPELERYGIPVSVIGRSGRPATVAGVVSLLRRRRPDLVHTTLFESDLAGRTAAAIARIPVVSSLVNTPYGPAHAAESGVSPYRLRAAQAADALTARVVRRFHAVSQPAADAYAAGLRLRRERIEVIPDGRDLDRLGRRGAERRATARAALGIGPEIPLLLTVGRQDPQKGLDVLLRAVPLLRADHPDMLTIVAGREGRASDGLRRLVAEEGLDHAVRFLGHRDDVAELLCAADVFVLPSWREGLPGAVIEAMAMETPIVASDLPSVREAVGGGDHALLVTPGDPTVLAGAIAAVLSDPGDAACRVAVARQRVVQHFDIGRVSERMVNFYARSMDVAH